MGLGDYPALSHLKPPTIVLMSVPNQPSETVPVLSLLLQAQRALQRGDVAQSQSLSKAALQHAQDTLDLQTQAQALLCLAHGDRMVSRFRRAQETAQRAASLFEIAGDHVGESEALSVVAHTLGVMGHSEEGVESALLAVKLNEGGEPLSVGMSYNYLGLAYACAFSFDKADAALQHSIDLLDGNGLWTEAHLPRINQRTMEITRCFFDRYYHGEFRSLQRLADLRHAHARATQVPSNLLVFQGAQLKTQVMLGLADGFEACWLGQWDLAQQNADFAQSVQARGDSNPSVTLLEIWLRVEIAWARADWAQAEAQAQRMLEMANQIDNEHMVGIAYLLSAQVLSAQGKDRLAQAFLRALKLRENNLRLEAIRSREERIEWQLKARASQANARRLAEEAQRLQQLVLEDALTGLFNRRHLEDMVPEMLRRGQERGLSSAMAFVDVDHFKQINDNFSHRVGDAVLKSLATILRSFVREGDVPVRLGGDEFVVAFAHVEERDAEGLAQRIHEAVRSFDWDALHPGLAVTASVGVAVAEAGDTLDTWLHRCDLCMYQEKDSRRQGLA